MTVLKDNLILYHGSYCEIIHPDLQKCSRYKDFGQGFYLTTSQDQARSFAVLSTHKAIAGAVIDESQKYGFVSSFKLPDVTGLNVFSFETADVDWLHCIVAHRRTETFPGLRDSFEKYDIIMGKIANDNTNATITAYMSSTFGAVGSAQSDTICINLLLPERLKDQFCFRSMAAVSKLQFMGSEKVCL